MLKRQINFTTNWNNKLYCDHYTTIRLASPYYQVGMCYDIELRKEYLHSAVILEIKFIMLKDVGKYISYLDAGLSVQDFRNLMNRFYPNKNWETQRLVIMLLQKVSNQRLEQEPKHEHEQKTLNFRTGAQPYDINNYKEHEHNENDIRGLIEDSEHLNQNL